ncbi:MAG: CheY-like chemotaxis protein [Candidatus Latescibacterota bacterium]|jgi:CheY-like chemotaxis protein
MNKPQIDLTGSKILAVDDVPANLDVLSQSLEADDLLGVIEVDQIG